MTLIGLAVLIEYLVRTEARMLEDGGYFDDGVFGYDFSEGYTSLESGAPKVRPYRESALKRWRRRRSDLRRQRRVAREAAEERRMDEILEKLHREGRVGPDGRRESVSGPRQRAISQPDEKHVNEPSGSRIDAASSGAPATAITAAAGEPFLEAIESGPLVLDAGMGTRLMARGSIRGRTIRHSGTCTRPDDVLAIHRRDVAAGSGAILTNTFGANRFWLAQVRATRRRSSRSIAAPSGWLAWPRARAGSSSATSVRQPRWTEGAAAEQAAILVDAGVDALIFETYRFPEVERVLA